MATFHLSILKETHRMMADDRLRSGLDDRHANSRTDRDIILHYILRIKNKFTIITKQNKVHRSINDP